MISHHPPASNRNILNFYGHLNVRFIFDITKTMLRPSTFAGLLLSLTTLAACRNASPGSATVGRKSRFDSLSQQVKIPPAEDTFPALEIRDSSLASLRFPKVIAIPVNAMTFSFLYAAPYPINISGTTIGTAVNDTGYVFTKSFSIENSTFGTPNSDGLTGLFSSAFNSRFVVKNNDFHAALSFCDCIFRDTAIFVNTSADNLHCLFSFCIFKRGLTFNDRSLKNEQDKPDEPVNGSHFKTNLIFDRCLLQRKLDLSECHFDSGSRFIFSRTPLPDTLDLTNTRLTASIDLTAAKLQDIDTKCEINLMGCDIEKLKLGYGNFHLYIPDSLVHDKYSRDQISATYEALLNNFQKNGFKDSYRQLALEYKDWQARHDFFTRISGIWWGYGYRKWQLLLWTFGFLLVFSLVNLALYKRIYSTYPIKDFAMDEYDFSPNRVTRFFQQLLISATYTGWIFFKLSIDFDKISIQRLGWLFIILIEYLIGILCTAYLINWIVSK